jgi:hypothetical protein
MADAGRRKRLGSGLLTSALAALLCAGCGGATSAASNGGNGNGGASGTGGSSAIGGTGGSSASNVCPACTGAHCPVVLASGQDGADAIAADDNNVYWLNGGGGKAPTGTVMKLPLAGGAPVALATGQAEPAAIAIDATDVYWTDVGPDIAPGAGALMKVPLGGGVPVTLASGQSAPRAIAIDAGHVYWSSGSDVMTLPLDGSAPAMRVPISPGPGAAFDLAVDSNDLYWTSAGPIEKAPLGGGQGVTLAQAEESSSVAVDATSVYWRASEEPDCDARGAPPGCGPAGQLMKVPLGGGAAVTLASVGFDAREGGAWMTVDAHNVYWTDSDGLDGTVWSVPIAGGTPVMLACGQKYPLAIAVHGASLYWTDAGDPYKHDGAVMKLSLQ